MVKPKIKWTRRSDGLHRARLADGRELELYEVRGYSHLSEQHWVFDWFDLRHQFKRGPFSKLVDAMTSAAQYAALDDAAARKYRESLTAAAKSKARAKGTLRGFLEHVRELVTAFLRERGQEGDELARNVDELHGDEAFVEQRGDAFAEGAKPRAFVADWFCVNERDVPASNSDEEIAKRASAAKVDAAHAFIVEVKRLVRRHLDLGGREVDDIAALPGLAARALRENPNATPLQFVRWFAVTWNYDLRNVEPDGAILPETCRPGAHLLGCTHQPPLPLAPEIPAAATRLHKTPAAASSAEIPVTATLRQQRIYCGKERCARCNGRDDGAGGHGPYWYAIWKVGRRTRSKYVGRELPSDIATSRAVTMVDGVQVSAGFARASALSSQQPRA